MEKSSWQSRICAPLAGTLLAAACGASAWTGGMPGAYLRPPTGAAMTAMGGAQSASPAYLCTFWNPAQLSILDKRAFTLGSGLYSLGRTEAFSSLEFKATPRVGVGILGLYRGDPFLDNLYNDQEEKLESGAFTTLTVKVGLSYLVNRKITAGLSVGYFYQRLPSSYSGTSLIYSDATAIAGFSFGMQYKLTDSLMLGAVLRDIAPLQILSGEAPGIPMQWQLSSAGSTYNPMDTDVVMPTLVIGCLYHHHLLGRPLLVSSDIDAYVVDGKFTKLDHMEMVLHAGCEWQRWQTFRIRAGLGDLAFNRDITSDPVSYWHNFTFKFCAGFGWDPVKLRRGVTVNYSVSTDKVWASIDQMLDFVYKF